jgi:hypothetical protein
VAAFPTYAILLFDGFTEKPEAGVVRTPKEGGMVKQRKRFSRVLVPRPVRYFFGSKADYNNFLTWRESTIGRVGWFDWTDPKTGNVIQARIAGGEIDPKPTRKDLERWIVGMTIEAWGS